MCEYAFVRALVCGGSKELSLRRGDNRREADIGLRAAQRTGRVYNTMQRNGEGWEDQQSPERVRNGRGMGAEGWSRGMGSNAANEAGKQGSREAGTQEGSGSRERE